MPSETNKNDPRRPDPETFLKIAKSEEAYSSKGKLKIFLGYSAGVGKTYAMLEAARRIKNDGVDIVIGYVETHKRVETQALVEGLEVIPRKNLSYRGTVLPEMDLDVVIERKPKIAVVDELAHSNAPGSRHVKRFQDIEELLAEGIDVYTTLNIQHLESLNDVVAKVTGVSMHETVPDRILDDAREIEVVDIPIGDLLKRLREGRVYISEAAERALQNFFNESNLTALRELTLRRAAKRIDTQMQGFLRRRITGGPLPVGERLLVCISSYPSSSELVRAGRLLAAGLDAEWFAVYVETPGEANLSVEKKEQLAKTLKLAEELGAKVATVTDQTPADGVIHYARRHNATKILIGKPLKRRLKDVLAGTVVDQLIRKSGEIDVYVINRSSRESGKKETAAEFQPLSWGVYLKSLFLVAVASGLGILTRQYLEPTNLVMFYLLAVVTSAIFLGRGPSIFASIASVLAFDFLLVPPFYTFVVNDAQYLVTFIMFFVVALIISTLTIRTKEQAESARSREAHTASLYELSRDLASAREKQTVFQALLKHIKESLGASVAVFSLEKDGLKLSLKTESFPFNDHESAVADWTLKNGQPAGKGTDTLPGTAGYYIPFKTRRKVYGTLGIVLKEKAVRLHIEDKRLLESFSGQTAIALERIDLSEEAEKSRFLEEREKLQSALFNSISHDLRTPLVSITGSLSGMRENLKMSEEARKELLDNAYEEADRLNRLMGNLLDMARLEANAMKVSPHPCEIRDVVGSSLKELEERLSDRKVTVEIEPNIPHIPMDFSLMMKVLVNLIDNAVKYAPFGLPIDIQAKKTEGNIEIKILDRGLGIPPSDLEPIFDKFYRVKRPENFEGTGLGLSICKGIVEAHQGKIWAENRPGGGAIATVSLPIKT